MRLLADVRSGRPKVSSSSGGPAASEQRAIQLQATGPLAGRRVLVIGGAHDQAAAARAEVVRLGGAAAVNLSANVSDVLLLVDGERDPRLPRALAAGVRVHQGEGALQLAATDATTSDARSRNPAAPLRLAEPPIQLGDAEICEDQVFCLSPMLLRGVVLDLPDEEVWTVNVSWRADALVDGTELNVVTFLLDEGEQVVADEDFVFYNHPATEDGAVALSVDGDSDSEQSVRID